MQKRFLIAALMSLLAGIAILIYADIKGPYWQFFRYYVGDVVAVAFLYFVLSLFWKAPAYLRGLAIAAIAVTIEFAQLFGLTPNNGSFLAEIIFGSHFEIWDFLAYGVGLAGAVGIDWLTTKQKRSQPND